MLPETSPSSGAESHSKRAALLAIDRFLREVNAAIKVLIIFTLLDVCLYEGK